MTDKQILRLLNELWADLGDPHFIWQVVALAVCLSLAYLLSAWWHRRRPESSGGRLEAVGARLAFPVLALLLLAVTEEVLKSAIHVNLLKLALALVASLLLVRTVVYVLRQSFPSALWLASGERLIALIIWSGLALYITDLAPLFIEAMERVRFPLGKQKIDLWMIVHGLVTVFLTMVFALWAAGLVERRLMGMERVDSSLRIVFVRIAKALFTLLAIILSLSLVGIDMTALSVFTGALGVGLGFGLQKIASNYVAGFIILLDRSIRLGNMVQVDPQASGLVTRITTRYTVLRNLAGVEFIVPNETLVANIVQNQSYSDNSVRISTQVGIGYGSDVEAAMRLLREVAAAHPRVLADPPPAALLVAFQDSALLLEVGFWIADPQSGTGNIRSDINLAIWQAFKKNGVDIPFPQRQVHLVETR